MNCYRPSPLINVNNPINQVTANQDVQCACSHAKNGLQKMGYKKRATKNAIQ